MEYRELVEVYKKLESTTKRLEKTSIISGLLKKTSTDELSVIMMLLQGRIYPPWDERKIGVASRLVLKAINIASGIDVNKIEEEWKQSGDLGLTAEKIISGKKQVTLFSSSLDVKKVFDNLIKLSSMEGEGAVDQKVKLIAELLTNASPLEARYIVRTVLEDLRIGVGEGSVRDAIVWAFLYPIKYNKEENDIQLSDEEREKYNKLVDILQEAVDITNDFSEVAVIAKEKGRDGLSKVNLEVGKPIKVMLYQKAKDMEDAFSIVGKPAACFPKNSIIYSNPHPRFIESFKEGELVIGKNGKYNRILNIFQRYYSGSLVRIIPHYLLPYNLTPEHRILAIKHNKCSWKSRNIICRPNCQEQKYSCRRLYNNYIAEWVKAEELKKGDFLILPKFKEESKIKKLDLADCCKGIQVKGNKIRLFSDKKGTFKGKWICRYIKLNEEFFELMGWYLAEGCASNKDRSFRFTLGIDEKEEARRIKTLIKKVFSVDSNISYLEERSVIKIRGFSTILAKFLLDSFGKKSKEKFIPFFILTSNKKNIQIFLKAYIKGDGHKTSFGYVIVTSSHFIAYQSVLLFSKLDILPSVKKYKNKGKGDIIYRIALFGKQLDNLIPNIHKTKTFHNRFWDNKDFFYIPIYKTESIPFQGKVYNIETKDKTYLASTLVHNCEYKYDGFRMQLHRDGDKIKLFTRRLENVTKQFPDVVKVVRENIDSSNYILDAEIIGIDPKTGRWMAFQNISQRIKRKYDIIRMSKDIPVMINIFDAMQVNGENIIKKPFSFRRELIKKITSEVPEKLQLAKEIITEDIKDAEKFYNESLDKGNEGIMVKALDKPYKPGSRVGYGVKVKPVMETLDLVIVGADWGEGKRAHWLSSFTIACKSGDKFLEIGKVGTGIKEKEEEGVSFLQLTNMLKPLIISEKGKEVIVKPSVIIEVNYEEIQKSVNYNSGYALRFPRLVRLREDKSLDEVSDLSMVKELYDKQRGR